MARERFGVDVSDLPQANHLRRGEIDHWKLSLSGDMAT
jgi:hypothetical protein